MLMKKTLFFFLFISFQLFAQNKQITIDDIYDGLFRPDYLYGLQALPQSDYYSKIEVNRSARAYEIGIYDYATREKIETAFSTSKYPFIGYFEYAFSPDETKIIIGSKIEQIYRHSRRGIYYVYDRKKQRLTKIDEQFIQEPSFSPDGKKIAFVKDNDLYVKNLSSNISIRVTKDGKKNHIINAIPDWVYEEEFSYSKAYEWSKNSEMVAYVRFDESQVPEFSMIRYGEDLYPQVETFKYPKAGEPNSKVTLHVYYLKTGKKENINLGNYEYLPRIYWTDQNYLMAISLNRHQNHLKLHLYSTISKKEAVIIDLKDDRYIDLEAMDNLTFLPNGDFIWSNESSGYNHFYLYDMRGRLKNQITKGNWEVTDFYGFDRKTKRIFYQSTENGSINRSIYSIDLKGNNKKLLSPRSGTSDAEFSAHFKYFINTYSSTKIPYTFTVNDAKTGEVISTIIDNQALLEKLKPYHLPPKVFVNFKAADGMTNLNGYIIEPENTAGKIPVLIYQYNGPNVQTVLNQWNSYNDYFHYLLVQKGYMVISVDTRGTGGKGADFKKSTYKQLGKLELDDVTAVAKNWATHSFIDENRIAIWGWSFGGYMASNAILKRGDVFSMAIAVAPVTNWRFYDTVYTERFMQTPQENPEGYDDNSPLSYTDGLTGKFLLIHGSADDNVHVQNSMRLAKKLQENDQPFDEMIYTDKNHGIYGGKTRQHLFKKMLKYIEDNL